MTNLLEQAIHDKNIIYVKELLDDGASLRIVDIKAIGGQDISISFMQV